MGLENTAGLGVRNWYGAVPTVTDGKLTKKFGGEVSTSGHIREVEYVWSYDDLPDGPGATNLAMEYVFPKGSTLLESTLQVITAAAGGTSYTIGLEQNGGTAIDADGLHTAAQLVTASLTAGASLKGGGALIGVTTDATYDSRLTIAASGTFTAGKYRLLVRYLPPMLGAGPEANRLD